jgi:hypothetical protein
MDCNLKDKVFPHRTEYIDQNTGFDTFGPMHHIRGYIIRVPSFQRLFMTADLNFEYPAFHELGSSKSPVLWRIFLRLTTLQQTTALA